MSPFQTDPRAREATPPAAPPATPQPCAQPPRAPAAAPDPGCPPGRPRRQQPARGTRLARRPDSGPALTPQQRLLLLDAWRRSGLPAGDFAPLVGVSKHTL